MTFAIESDANEPDAKKSKTVFNAKVSFHFPDVSEDGKVTVSDNRICFDSKTYSKETFSVSIKESDNKLDKQF